MGWDGLVLLSFVFFHFPILESKLGHESQLVRETERESLLHDNL